MSIIKRKAGSEDIVKSVLEFDETPTEGSPNLVESGAVAAAIGNLGKPLQWKGPATVAQLNAGITGIQPGWTYTLTDAGTLTDGSVAVEKDDEVAWTEDGEWFKVGGEKNIAVFTGTYNPNSNPSDYSGMPSSTDVKAAVDAGKDVVLQLSFTQQGATLTLEYGLSQVTSGTIDFTSRKPLTNSSTNTLYYPVVKMTFAGPGNPWGWASGKDFEEKFAIFDIDGGTLPTASKVYAARDAGKLVFLRCSADLNVNSEYTLEAGTILSLCMDTGRPGYSAHDMEFSCTGVFKGTESVTIRAVMHENGSWEWHAYDTGAVRNGGVLTDAASVNVPNNALSTLSTAQATLTLNVNVDSGEVPNFAVEITPSVDVTLTVTKKVGNTTTTLNPSVSGGTSLTTGKLYQVTCVGSCWTLAEFTLPTP